ncbi:MAG: hypothetical protein ACK5AZ_12520 [Bryobacteraceae bacterium]
MIRRRALLKLAAFAPALLRAQTPATRRQISGVYPHLALFNRGNECGIGAVVLWAGRLWAVTYSPHQPGGSSDKLYEIDEYLNLAIRPESIGGTPANRMIHRESEQLFIGPYVIDEQRRVRVIPYERAYGRPTGNARHLTDPERKIYLATMEEGFYEIDVQTLEVTQLYEDANAMVRRKAATNIAGPLLPGYHGKGLYSGQGRLVYSNNGELGGERQPPSIPSGCLAEWDSKDWTVVRRNQFTEVTGPGGLLGNPNPAADPVWSIGWDHRSLILMLLDRGRWHAYRLPKASHTYDGAHGWNTEWPRIREIGERDLLMTMHGMFWRFPASFTAANSAGLRPRSSYLRVIGDFARWRDRVVFGCDDTAVSEFTNKRKAKGEIAGPGQSQSNLWFLPPERLDSLGPVIGRGALWIEEDLKPGDASDPYLFAGFDRRILHLAHEHNADVPAGGYAWTAFSPGEQAEWLRLRAEDPPPRPQLFCTMPSPTTAARKPAPSFPLSRRPPAATSAAASSGPAEKTAGLCSSPPAASHPAAPPPRRSTSSTPNSASAPSATTRPSDGWKRSSRFRTSSA